MRITIAVLLALVFVLGAFLFVQAQTIYIPFVGDPTANIATVEPYPSAPLCAMHDPITYHGLWNEVDGCHHNHTHNYNGLAPEVQAIFGDYTAYTGQQVSYPWQTFAGAAPGLAQPPTNPVWENDAKHAGYKFDFYDFPPAQYGCPVAQTNTASVPNAWLIERHSLGHKGDFMARVHSAWAMIRFCIPNQPGQVAYLYTGGWQDFGQRISPYQGHIYPIPGSPSPTYPSPRAPYIAHSCINHADCRGDNESNTSWISFAQMIPGHKLLGFGFRSNDSQQKIDASGGFNTADPTFVYLCNDGNGNFVPTGCRFNHSTGHTYQVTGNIPASYDLLDGVDDDRVNYTGYTDRWGNVVTGCTANALDCVPVKMLNLPVGKYHVNVAQYGLTGIHEDLPEYDWCRSATGETVDCDSEGAIASGWIGSEN